MSKKKKQDDQVAEDTCVWQISDNCSGDVEVRKLFEGELEIPACEAHYQQHKDIMILHANGYDIEQILQEDADWRRKEVLMLDLSSVADVDDATL